MAIGLIVLLSGGSLLAADDSNDRLAFETESGFFSRDLQELSAFPLISQRPDRLESSDNLPTPKRSTISRSEGLSSVRADITLPPTSVPSDLAAAEFAEFGTLRHVMGTSRYDAPLDYYWKSPAFCHRALYFEQAALERYGVTSKVAQPLLSAARFYGTVPLLPVLCLKDIAQFRPSTLGYLRPGSPLP
jgi:hypothetical protein